MTIFLHNIKTIRFVRNSFGLSLELTERASPVHPTVQHSINFLDANNEIEITDLPKSLEPLTEPLT